jgi:hypothetical protein
VETLKVELAKETHAHKEVVANLEHYYSKETQLQGFKIRAEVNAKVFTALKELGVLKEPGDDPEAQVPKKLLSHSTVPLRC